MTTAKPKKLPREQPWYVYVIRASDDSLYTGITTDIQRRFKEHRGTEKGARYFRGRQPLEVVYRECLPDRGSALRREADIKKLSRDQKLELIKGYRETQRHCQKGDAFKANAF